MTQLMCAASARSRRLLLQAQRLSGLCKYELVSLFAHWAYCSRVKRRYGLPFLYLFRTIITRGVHWAASRTWWSYAMKQ